MNRRVRKAWARSLSRGPNCLPNSTYLGYPALMIGEWVQDAFWGLRSGSHKNSKEGPSALLAVPAHFCPTPCLSQAQYVLGPQNIPWAHMSHVGSYAGELPDMSCFTLYRESRSSKGLAHVRQAEHSEQPFPSFEAHSIPAMALHTQARLLQLNSTSFLPRNRSFRPQALGI